MPERIIFPEFRDEFEFTRYPFADGASLTADTLQQIEVDIFLDACLYPIGGGSRVYISQIDITSSDATFTLSDSARKPLATASFNLADPPDVLYFQDSLDRPAGIIISQASRLLRFGSWNIGTHKFALGATEFVASAVIPTPERGVRAIQLEDGTLVTGDVWLVGEGGIVLQEVLGSIEIDVVGDPLFVREQCTDAGEFAVPNFIRRINNCPPDQTGNFSMTIGDHQNEKTILRVYNDTSGLVVEAVGKTITQRGT